MSERPVCPWALLLGALASFVACCAAGAWYSRRPLYEHFERFHQPISPEGLHYPTASQVLALARRELPPDKVAVIVGGNSVLHGAGQRVEHLWTKALQAELGDGYRVLNLAMRGAQPAEFGATVAEALGREHPRVLFVTLTGYGFGGHPDGALYRYFFWDARRKGLLLPHPAREEFLRQAEADEPAGPWRQLRGGPEHRAEVERQARLNSCCYFNDLWNVVSYRRLSLVWSPWVLYHQFRPRKDFPDPDPGPAITFAVRYSPAADASALRKMRAWFADYPAALAYRGPEVDPERSPMVRQLRGCFPEACRPRTLVLVPHENPYYLGQLAPAEQALSRRLVLDQVRAVEAAGFAALEVGRDFTVDDCNDGGGHYTEPGGRRLAAEVAPKLRDMACRLGYLGKGE